MRVSLYQYQLSTNWLIQYLQAITFSQHLFQYDTEPHGKIPLQFCLNFLTRESASTSDCRVPISRWRSVREIILYNYTRYRITINEGRERGEFIDLCEMARQRSSTYSSRLGHLRRNRRRTTDRSNDQHWFLVSARSNPTDLSA